MSELKVHKAYNRWLDEEMPTPNDDLICNDVYLKSEADKVIADLKESHKKEVGQLLIEIAELKKKRDTAENLLHKALDCVSNGKNHIISLARKNNHSNYKRCLAMAKYWVAVSYHCVDDKHRQSAERHHRKWLDLARKLKEAK